MSTISQDKIELVKELLKAIHRGASPKELREKFKDMLSRISPLEIPLIEQELVREGLPIDEILKLCDLHVELFREVLASRELKGIPKGHPLDLLMRENEWILKQAEAVGVYAQALANARTIDEAKERLGSLQVILQKLRGVRLHYRKIQMLLFPYLERRGIIAVPRVLWGREDQVIAKLRRLLSELEEYKSKSSLEAFATIVNQALELSNDLADLVFRENKILYPAVYALFTEGEWAAIAGIAKDMGYIVDVGDTEWKSTAKPVYPYELRTVVTPEQLEKLPPEFRAAIERSGLQPDTYRVNREFDFELKTGFLTPEEVEGIFRSLPLEVTYADINDRVRFFSESEIAGGFVRAKTILGRRIPFCHPPRLENYVMMNVEGIKRGQFKYREFWTRQGDRIIRVIITPVKGRDGRLLGVLEVVEDLTEVIAKPDEIKKRIVVL